VTHEKESDKNISYVNPFGIGFIFKRSRARSRHLLHGEILDVDPCSFGGIGIIGVKEMPRFYRHVLLEKQFPHHSAVGFAHAGKTLFDAMKLLGIDDLSYNQPKGERYKTENPFA
jgi:hypothetical protein